MKTERFLPSNQLRPFVKAFLLIDSEEGMHNQILPDTSVVMAFRCAGCVSYTKDETRIELPLSVITGLRNSLRVMNYDKGAMMLLVLFQPGGMTALVREPIHELFNLSVPLNQLMPSWLTDKIEEQLTEAITNQQRITIVEQFLLSTLTDRAGDKLISEAIRQIYLSKGTVRVKEMLSQLPISQDPFEKRFRRIVGTSPKQFSEIVRLRSLIQQHSSAHSLTEAAYLAGYYDQSHFIKTFKHFTDQTPTSFFKTGRFW